MSDWLDVVIEVGLHTVDVLINPEGEGESRPFVLGCLTVSCVVGVGVLLVIWLR